MNTSLMIAVERIVRPIVAPRDRKQRMREELYAHIDSIYKEEFEKSGDEAAACTTATVRLGEPEIVRAELQGTVPFWKQTLIRGDQMFGRKPKEPRLRYSIRISIMALVFSAVMYLGAFGLGILVSQQISLLEMIPWIFYMPLVFSWNFFVIAMCAQPFLEPQGVLEKKRGVVLAGLIFGASAAATELLLLNPFTWDQPPIGLFLLPTIAFIAGWGMFVLVVSLIRIEKQQSIPWETLELAD